MLPEHYSPEMTSAWRQFLNKIYCRWAVWLGLLAVVALVNTILNMMYPSFFMKTNNLTGPMMMVLWGCGLYIYIREISKRTVPVQLHYARYALGLVVWGNVFASGQMGLVYLDEAWRSLASVFMIAAPAVALAVFCWLVKRYNVDVSVESFRRNFIIGLFVAVPLLCGVYALLPEPNLGLLLASLATASAGWLFNIVMAFHCFRETFERHYANGSLDQALLVEGYVGMGRIFRLGFWRLGLASLLMLYSLALLYVMFPRYNQSITDGVTKITLIMDAVKGKTQESAAAEAVVGSEPSATASPGGEQSSGN